MSDPAPPHIGMHGRGWQETYRGGSREAEARQFQELAAEITRVQDRWRARTDAPVVRRPFHTKTLAAVANAELHVLEDLSEDLHVGFLQPGARYRTTVRFSNGHATSRPDTKPDLRGVALRIHVEAGVEQDLLLTNAPASHARDARQFLVAATASTMGGVRGALHLLRRLGPVETVGMVLALAPPMLRRIDSIATEAFWSRSATAVGPVAVRLKLQPEAVPDRRRLASGPDKLRHDVVERLRRGDLAFGLQVQRYVDAARTPIENGRARWREQEAPLETIARLTIPHQDLMSADAVTTAAAIDGLVFSPWNTTEGLRPLGNLNRARASVYAASALHRGATDQG